MRVDRLMAAIFTVLGWHPWGYLDWHGSQYGTHFYSINAAGTAALLEHEPDPIRQSTKGEQT